MSAAALTDHAKGKQKALNRRQLFAESKPFIRPFEMDALWIFWAAYCEGSFPELAQGLTREQVYQFTLDKLSRNDENLLVDDDNLKYAGKRGPVGIVIVKREGTRIEPKFIFFSWATEQNVLRTKVVYFWATSYGKRHATCMLRCEHEEHVVLRNISKKYGFLEYAGKIRCGSVNGKDEYVYSVPSQKSLSQRGRSKPCLH